MDGVKEEKTKVKDPGTKTRMAKVGTLTSGIRTIGTNNGTIKEKERIKVVSLNMETNELQLLRIPKLRVQVKPHINQSPRSQLCLLWKRWQKEARGNLIGLIDRGVPGQLVVEFLEVRSVRET